MSRITDELSKYGCDMNTTLERFLGDEDFYEKCIIEMLGDSSFRELGEALEQKNVKAAFESVIKSFHGSIIIRTASLTHALCYIIVFTKIHKFP